MKTKKKLNLFIVVLFAAVALFLLPATSSKAQAWNVPAKYKSMKNAKQGAKDTEGVGKNLYKQHCASCHGTTGKGDGKKASGLETEMRDFSSAEVQKQTDGELYYKSFIGRNEMPNFEKKVASAGDKWLLINYIRTMKK